MLLPGWLRRLTCCSQGHIHADLRITLATGCVIGHHGQAMNEVRTVESSPAGSFSGWLKNPRIFFCSGYVHWQISNWRWQVCPGVKEQVPAPGFSISMSILTSQSTGRFLLSVHHMPCTVLDAEGTEVSQTEKQACPPVWWERQALNDYRSLSKLQKWKML